MSRKDGVPDQVTFRMITFLERSEARMGWNWKEALNRKKAKGADRTYPCLGTIPFSTTRQSKCDGSKVLCESILYREEALCMTETGTFTFSLPCYVMLCAYVCMYICMYTMYLCFHQITLCSIYRYSQDDIT